MYILQEKETNDKILQYRRCYERVFVRWHFDLLRADEKYRAETWTTTREKKRNKSLAINNGENETLRDKESVKKMKKMLFKVCDCTL